MNIKKIIPILIIILTSAPSYTVDVNDKTAINKSLMDAVMENKTEEVQKILLKGADPNTTNNGKTALMYATELINPVMVKNLLDAGADVTTRWGTQNALDLARRTSHRDITEILNDAYTKWVANQQKTPTVNVDTKTAVTAHANAANASTTNANTSNANTDTKNGSTPNANATNTNTTNANIANASTTNVNATTANTTNAPATINVDKAALNEALMTAVITNQTEEVQKLIKMGADPNTMHEGQTTLMHAVRHQNPTMVQDLIGAGANITPRFNNQNALEMAQKLPNRNIMDMLDRALSRKPL